MHCRGPVHMKPGLILKVATTLERFGKEAADKMRTSFIKRGSATARQEHRGPSGYKTRPAKVLSRAIAERNREYRARGMGRAKAA